MIAPVRRILAMEGREVRFRLECECRKLAGRVSAAVSKPGWRRSDLPGALAPDLPASDSWNAARTALGREDYTAAHAALAAHFSARHSPVPLSARVLPALADLIATRHPTAAEEAVRRAERIIEGRYDLLGYTGLDFGEPPDWHYDPVHRRRAPVVYWASVPYLDPASGDHKVIWELNRHQHLLALGRAHALTGERRFYDEFVLQLGGWLAANPPLLGINWASMLELAFRSLSWIWALEMFARSGSSADHAPWLVDLLLAIDRQLDHVEQNLSRYFSPNTHLSGEALALYVAGLALPELRKAPHRAAAGRQVLLEEASRQVLDDGGHAERSTHYHRYSTDFYLLAYAVARGAGDPAAPLLEEAARRQARYLRVITDDSGMRPPIGDDDGGQLFPICGRSAADCRDTLATAALLLEEPDLAGWPAPEETYWFCGLRAAGASQASGAKPVSAAFPASGYQVSRTPAGDHLVFDVGALGYLNAGHAHADALACTLTVGGRPVLIDPGTATYTMSPEVRTRFRSTMMHNTLVLDGRAQSEPAGPFHWSTRADARASLWRTAPGCDYMEGTHDGYAPRRHTRAILAVHGVGWVILDHVSGTGTAAVDTFWHFDPAWTAAPVSETVCALTDHSGRRLALASSLPLTLLPPGEHMLAHSSPAYGRIEPAPAATARWTGPLPITVATFVPANAQRADRLSIAGADIVVPPASGWRGAAFTIRWRTGSMHVLAAVELTGVTQGDMAAPPGLWGSAEARTDGRLAALLAHENGGAEVVVVNGTVAAPPAGARPQAHHGASPARRPLVRLASTMHPSAEHQG